MPRFPAAILLAASALLAACDAVPFAPQDQPFTDGAALSVVAADQGRLRTYTLTPCRDGTRICGSRTGDLSRTDAGAVVTGAWPGRSFRLSPGGSGTLDRNGVASPLAWN